MVRYETLFLTTPELTNDEFTNIDNALHKLIQEHRGSTLSCERWGKYHLAFPVNDHEYGIYGLLRFEADPAKTQVLVEAIRTLLAVKFNDVILRFITVALEGSSLIYYRPESLEETPVRDVDTFLKENNMQGLMNNRRGYQAPSRGEGPVGTTQDEEA